MSWRVHLTNRALLRLDILENEKSVLLAAWTQPGRVSYFDLNVAALLCEEQFEGLQERDPKQWAQLRDGIHAPNGMLPQIIPIEDATLYLGLDATLRVYHQTDGSTIVVQDSGETRLEGRLLALSLDRATGLIGGIDSEGKLHLYQKAVPVGRFDIGLKALQSRLPVALVLGQGRVIVAHGRQLIETDTAGKVQRCTELHYPVGAMAVAEDGKTLACCDRETNVIRVYDSAAMSPRYQRHAEDLMVKATQVQLLADPPPQMAVLNNLVLNAKGVLAFALAGVLCVTDTEQMNMLPQTGPSA